MPTPRKYNGPCPTHARKRYDCKHCGAYYMQQRYVSKAARETRPAQAGIPIVYRELHWPVPAR